MTAELKASFILQLEDKLSSGVAALAKKLEALAKLARSLSMKGLDGADRALDRVGRAADGAAGKVYRVGGAAAKVAADLAKLNAVKVAPAIAMPKMRSGVPPIVLLPQAFRALPPIGIPPAPLPFGGGAGFGVRPSWAFQVGAAAAPGFAAMRTGAAALRRDMAATVHHAQELGRHTREIGERLLVAAATGFGLNHAVGEYARYENTLRHIGITAGVSKAELPRVIGEMTGQYNALALGTGQSSDKIAEAANFLITTGIGRGAVDKMLPIVARASTAYNTHIGDSVQAIFSLKENLHVSDEDMAGTISAMALAGKEGHFSFADMSRFLPDIAPLAAGAGLRGGAGARDLMAMLETSRRNAGTSGEANTNLRDFLSHLFGDSKRGLGHAFGLHGVDLNKLLLDAERQGISAPEAVLERVRQMTAGKTDIKKNLIIGSLFHNQQSASFVRGALADLEYMLHLREKLRGADSNTINDDFAKAADAALVKMRLAQEKLTQIIRRLGQGFAGILNPVNDGLDRVLMLIAWFDHQTIHATASLHGFRVEANDTFSGGSGLLDGILSWTGGFLAVGTALGLVLPILRLVGGGFRLLLSPLLLWGVGVLRAGWAVRVLMVAFSGLAAILSGLGAALGIGAAAVLGIAAVIAGAAYLIYQNWDQVGPWMQRLWDACAGYLRGFYEFFAGVFTGNFARAIGGLQTMLDSLKAFVAALWEGIKAAFVAFTTWLDEWTGGAVTRVIEGFKDSWRQMQAFFVELIASWKQPFDDFIKGIEDRLSRLRDLFRAGPAAPAPTGPESWPGGSPGAMPMSFRPGASSDEPLNIRIRVDQDGRVRDVATDYRGKDVQASIFRGEMLARA